MAFWWDIRSNVKILSPKNPWDKKSGIGDFDLGFFRGFLLTENSRSSDHSYKSPRYNEFGYLRPISIQTKKGEDAYTVTPSDEHLWKLAKRMFEGSNSVLQSFSGRVNDILVG